jgi:hypothetical protein
LDCFNKEKMKFLAILGCVWVLVGCSAMPAAQQQVTLEAKVVCCKDVKAFEYVSLRPDTDARFVLDEKSPVYQFARGKSYFKAFEVETAPNRFLFVKSYFNGMLIGQYLQPIFLFLDAGYEPLVALTPRQEFEEGNMFRDNNAHMVGGVRIPASAKYVVVYTAKFDAPPNAATTRPSVGVFMSGTTPIVMRNSGKAIPLERAPSGELLVRVFDVPEGK